MKILKAYKLPRLPKSRRDPVGGERLVSKAFKKIKAGEGEAKKSLEKLVMSIPVRYVTKNAIETVIDRVLGRTSTFGWVYTYDAESAKKIADEIEVIMLKWLTEGFELRSLSAGFIEESAKQASTQAFTNLSAISTVYSDRRQLIDVLYSDHYRTKLELALLKSYDEWTTMIEQQRTIMSRIIGEAVVAGRNPNEITEELMLRVDVTKSMAENIAQSEITNILREFRIFEGQEASSLLGLDIQYFWTSALLPTTRITHAERHGKVYTDKNIQNFYSINGNRFRCHCSITEVVVDESAMLPNGIKQAYRKELDNWEKEK